jgi:hypothetical protein
MMPPSVGKYLPIIEHQIKPIAIINRILFTVLVVKYLSSNYCLHHCERCLLRIKLSSCSTSLLSIIMLLGAKKIKQKTETREKPSEIPKLSLLTILLARGGGAVEERSFFRFCIILILIVCSAAESAYCNTLTACSSMRIFLQ